MLGPDLTRGDFYVSDFRDGRNNQGLLHHTCVDARSSATMAAKLPVSIPASLVGATGLGPGFYLPLATCP